MDKSQFILRGKHYPKTIKTIKNKNKKLKKQKQKKDRKRGKSGGGYRLYILKAGQFLKRVIYKLREDL